MAELKNVYIASAVRTPIGSFRSQFKDTSALNLGTCVVREAISRAGISATDVEEVIVGSVLTAGLGQNIARQICIAAGLPDSVQAVTVNKVCSSSMKAIILAAQAIELGYHTVMIAAGVENMSRVPLYLERGEITYGTVSLADGIQKDGLTDAMSEQAMGYCAEKTAKAYCITREEQDAYAVGSYKRAAISWKQGLFADEIMPMKIPQKKGSFIEVREDEEFQRLVESKVSTLSPAFLKDGTGTITAANASSLSDGAAALTLVRGDSTNTQENCLASIIGYAEDGVNPVDFTIAPVGAVRKLLNVINLDISDISLWEINEAFSVTVIAFIKELKLDPSCVNIKGGAVALGHPLGASGARIVVTLIHSLKAGQLGVAAICNGGGEACAILIKKL